MEPTLLSVLSLLAIFLNEAGGNNDTTNVMKIRSRHGKSADADNFLESSGKTKREFFPPDLGVIVAAVETLPNSRCRNDSRAVLEAVARHEKWGMQSKCGPWQRDTNNNYYLKNKKWSSTSI